MSGWSMHLFASMEIIDIATIALVNHFRLKPESRDVDNVIEECLSPHSFV